MVSRASRLSQDTDSYSSPLSISADGNSLLAVQLHSESNIWIAPSDDLSEARQVTFSDLRQLTTGSENTDPHPTPDSKWVVYTSTHAGKRFVCRIPVGGGESVRVTDKESSYPRVSHDGKFIACGYRADDDATLQLAIVAIEDGTLVKLFDVPPSANFIQGIRWTPDDKAVCYRDWANGIWRQDLGGGPPTRLKGLPEEKIYAYGWSRDGKLFAFTHGREISDAVLIKDFK